MKASDYLSVNNLSYFNADLKIRTYKLSHINFQFLKPKLSYMILFIFLVLRFPKTFSTKV